MKIIITIIVIIVVYKIFINMILPNILTSFANKQFKNMENAIKKKYGINEEEPEEYTSYEEIEHQGLDKKTKGHH